MKTIDCTGDVCVGDYIYFEQAQFSGTWKKPKYEGKIKVEGEIIKESYGQKTGQHTFTILLPTGFKMLIKGRNLYDNGTMRKEWADEKLRFSVLREKHRRGEMSRRRFRE